MYSLITNYYTLSMELSMTSMDCHRRCVRATCEFPVGSGGLA